MKKILPLLIMGMLVLTGLVGAAVTTEPIEVNSLVEIDNSLENTQGRDDPEATHTAFAEYATATWCGYCKYAHGALKQLYAEGKDFYYVSLVTDKNGKAQQRVNQYNTYGYPTVYWDGGYKVNVGAGSIPSAKTAYTNSINQCGARAVEDVDVSLEIHWLGGTKISVEATVENNEATTYGGHIRVFITEIESSMGWKDTAGNPYTFAMLDYAFNTPISIPAGGTWNDYMEWTGSSYGFSSVTPGNLMVIAAVYNDEWHQGYSYPPSSHPFDAYYVDECVGAMPMTFWADTYEIPASTGGTVNLYLSGERACFNAKYAVLGSVSGTEPGTTLPGGTVLPLNWDSFTDVILLLANSAVFPNFIGTFDLSGQATAQIVAPPLPGYAGTTMQFAYTKYDPFGYVSNPIEIKIV